MSHSRDALPSPSDNVSAPPTETEPPVNPDGASPSVTTTDSNGVAETEPSAEDAGIEEVETGSAPDETAGTAGTAGGAGAAEAVGGEPAHLSAQAPVAAMTADVTVGVAADMADATVEMAAVVDGPVPGAPGDAEGGTGAETTDTPKPLLVS